MWYFFNPRGVRLFSSIFIPFFLFLPIPFYFVAQNESVARDKGKIAIKDDPCVISLDDLLCEKLGAQRPFSTSNPGLKEKNSDSEGIPFPQLFMYF